MADARGQHYHRGDSPQGDFSNWMSWVDGSTKISELSLPGTHETLSHFGGDAVENNTLDITEQLQSGIRVMDIRLRLVFNDTGDLSSDDGSVWDLEVYHGSVYQKAGFEEDVCRPIKDFLARNPTEAVFVRLGTAGVPDPHPNEWVDDNGVSQEMTNKGEDFHTVFEDYATRPHCSAVLGTWPPATNPPVGNPTTYIPTLGQVRGTMVPIEDWSNNEPYGPDWPSKPTYSQDYQVTVTTDVDKKWGLIEKHFVDTNAGSSEVLWANHLSGSSAGIYPYTLANGFAVWDKGMNERTLDYLFSGVNDRTGMVMMDFPGIDLIAAIIAHNFKLAETPGNPSHGFRGVDDWQNVIDHMADVANSDTSYSVGRDQMAQFLRAMVPDQAVHVLVLSPTGWATSTPDMFGMTARIDLDDRTYLFVRSATKSRPLTDTSSKRDFRDPLAVVITELSDGATAGARRTAIVDHLNTNHPGDVWNVAVRPLSDTWAVSTHGSGWSFDFDGFRHYVWGTKADDAPGIATAGDVAGEEGATVAIDLSPSFDPLGGDLTFRWDIGDDGAWEQTDFVADRSILVFNDTEGIVPVRIEAKNAQLTSSTVVDVEFTNVAPYLLETPIQSGSDEGGAVTIGGRFADQGVGDSHTVSISWGDGTATEIHVPSPAGKPLERTFALDHTYPDDGVYSARVEVTDGGRGPNSFVRHDFTINVDDVAPVITVEEPDAGPSPHAVDLYGAIADPGTDTFTLTVDWGDDSPTETTTAPGWTNCRYCFVLPSHTYMAAPPGAIFDVKLTVVDDDNAAATDEYQFPVRVGDGGLFRPSFTHDCPTEITTSELRCTGTVVDPDNSSWTGGIVAVDPSGTPSTASQHVFDGTSFPIEFDLDVNGRHRLDVTLIDDDGLANYISGSRVFVDVRKPGVAVEFSNDRVGEPIRFDVELIEALRENLQPIFVEFGDGASTVRHVQPGDTYVMDPTPISHTYLAQGQYTVRVWQLDAGYDFGFDETFDLVVGPSGPDFDAGPDEDLARRRIQRQFPIEFHGAPGQVRADWGDGSIALLYAPDYRLDHTYADNGTYTVEVTANDESGTTRDYFDVTVAATNDPVAFEAGGDEQTITGEFHRRITIDDDDNDSWRIKALWGDGTVDQWTVHEPVFDLVHDYEAAGSHHVTVDVFDWDSSYRDTFSVTHHPPPEVTPDGPHVAGVGQTVAISATVDSIDASTYLWTSSPNDVAAEAADCTFADGTALSTTVTCTGEGEWVLALTADDGTADGAGATLLTVNNAPPTIDQITVTDHRGAAVSPSGAVVVGRQIDVDVEFSDAADDRHRAEFAVEGNTSIVEVPAGTRTVSEEVTFSAIGPSTIGIRIVDDAGADAAVELHVEVIDESIAVDRTLGERLRDIIDDPSSTAWQRARAVFALGSLELAAGHLTTADHEGAVADWATASRWAESLGVGVDVQMLEFAEYFYESALAESSASPWKVAIAERIASAASEIGIGDPARALRSWSRAIGRLAQ